MSFADLPFILKVLFAIWAGEVFVTLVFGLAVVLAYFFDETGD